LPKKIAFIGAGSFGFTRTLVRDILTFPEFADANLALMDIDAEKLGFITKAVKKIVKAGNYPAKVISTLNRKKAVEGADAVLITILQGGVQVWRHDIEIPMKYGVDITVGDTRGPSGIFRALRTIPVVLDICGTINDYAPNAVVLNYTNPMAMNCRAVQARYPNLTMTGLCHSVQGTARMLANWIGAPYDKVTYRCGGINHQSWYLDFKWDGKDAYPLIREAINAQPELSQKEPVRNEMFLSFGYYVTESSRHSSEYTPWYRKRPEIVEEFWPGGTGSGSHAHMLKNYLHREDTWRDNTKEELRKPVDLKRGGEYASSILNAIIGDGTMFQFNGNVRNFGLVDNLPHGCCVEVPVVASRRGLDPIPVGPLPPQCAALTSLNAQCEELAVEGIVAGNQDMVYHAIYMDPLTSAVCSLAEIKAMVDEMFQANMEYWSNVGVME
jgi:alpha-galactosidase